LAGVRKTFGGVVAVDDVSFVAEPGQVTALIGPNGSGKTTLLNMISGFYRPDRGEIRLGADLTSGRPPHEVGRLGVGRTFQTPAIPTDLTVRDVVVGAQIARHRLSFVETALRVGRYRTVQREDERVAMGVLGALALADRADDVASSLALGTRRMLELARAIACGQSLILLDEVASGLDLDEIVELDAVIRLMRDLGATVVLVEHNFTLVRALADKVVVLADGAPIAVGTPEEIERHPEVLTRYLGAGVALSGTSLRRQDEEPVL
jgi:branched-chain amino acid transport system permease protein